MKDHETNHSAHAPVRDSEEKHQHKSDVTDEEEWLMWDEDENDEGEEEPSPQPVRPWIKRTVGIILALVLLTNIIAFLPDIYNLQTIQFLKTNRALSNDANITRYKQAVVVVNANGRKGTGFNVAPQGTILTNHHVIAGEKTAMVSFKQGKTYIADVVVSDADLDLAVLRLRDNTLEIPALELATDADVQTGRPVYVIGNPLVFSHIANEGTVLDYVALEDSETTLLLIQAPIYRGNSGSPVINEEGKVIGIVFATTSLTYEGRTQTVGLAVPAHAILPYLES